MRNAAIQLLSRLMEDFGSVWNEINYFGYFAGKITFETPHEIWECQDPRFCEALSQSLMTGSALCKSEQEQTKNFGCLEPKF
jgi:hypothetical protein